VTYSVNRETKYSPSAAIATSRHAQARIDESSSMGRTRGGNHTGHGWTCTDCLVYSMRTIVAPHHRSLLPRPSWNSSPSAASTSPAGSWIVAVAIRPLRAIADSSERCIRRRTFRREPSGRTSTPRRCVDRDVFSIIFLYFLEPTIYIIFQHLIEGSSTASRTS